MCILTSSLFRPFDTRSYHGVHRHMGSRYKWRHCNRPGTESCLHKCICSPQGKSKEILLLRVSLCSGFHNSSDGRY